MLRKPAIQACTKPQAKHSTIMGIVVRFMISYGVLVPSEQGSESGLKVKPSCCLHFPRRAVYLQLAYGQSYQARSCRARPRAGQCLWLRANIRLQERRGREALRIGFK